MNELTRDQLIAAARQIGKTATLDVNMVDKALASDTISQEMADLLRDFILGGTND